MPWLLLACAPDPHWEGTRQACGLADGETATDPTGDGYLVTYDFDCAVGIGEDFGVRWEDFPNADLPGALDGDPLERFIAGAWMILAGDFGTVEEYVADPVVPTGFAEELTTLADRMDIAGDAPASQVLYEYAASAVDRTIANAEEADTVEIASCGTLGNTLRINRTNELDPAGWMGTVVHEAAHCYGIGRRHHVCDDRRGMDVDWEGAWAVEASLVLRWGEATGVYTVHDLRVLRPWLCDGVTIPEEFGERAGSGW